MSGISFEGDVSAMASDLARLEAEMQELDSFAFCTWCENRTPRDPESLRKHSLECGKSPIAERARKLERLCRELIVELEGEGYEVDALEALATLGRILEVRP